MSIVEDIGVARDIADKSPIVGECTLEYFQVPSGIQVVDLLKGVYTTTIVS